MAPLGRILAQVIVPIIATLARAIPAAYQQAVQNAKKGGASSATATATAFSKKLMSKEEAMMILNITDQQIVTDAQVVEQQYQRYFAANSMEKGGSFYLQSKVYRAKEMLDEYIKEQNTTATSSKE